MVSGANIGGEVVMFQTARLPNSVTDQAQECYIQVWRIHTPRWSSKPGSRSPFEPSVPCGT